MITQLFTFSPLFMPNSESLPSLFVQSFFFKVIRSCCSLKKIDCKRIPPNTLYKRATMSDLLPLLTLSQMSSVFPR